MAKTEYTIHALPGNPTTTDGEIATAFASLGPVTHRRVSDD